MSYVAQIWRDLVRTAQRMALREDCDLSMDATGGISVYHLRQPGLYATSKLNLDLIEEAARDRLGDILYSAVKRATDEVHHKLWAMGKTNNVVAGVAGRWRKWESC